jgi:hypothetical protein
LYGIIPSNNASASGKADSGIDASTILVFEVVASVAIFAATNPIAACERIVGIVRIVLRLLKGDLPI